MKEDFWELIYMIGWLLIIFGGFYLLMEGLHEWMDFWKF